MMKDFVTPGMRIFHEKKRDKKALAIQISALLGTYYFIFYLAWRALP